MIQPSTKQTYETLLMENGTDIKTVSRLLGHLDIQTTLNTYVPQYR